MTARIETLHPRALYAMLQACTNADDRARAALAFLRAGAGATSAHLYLARPEGIALAAASQGGTPPGMSEHVAEAWRECWEPQADNSRTLESAELGALLQPDTYWTSSAGERFERRVLGAHRGMCWSPIGIVMLGAAPGSALHPVHHGQIHALCMALIDAADVEARAEDE